jgi:NADP-dependent 3-hydroxy acid dehydrogenase YdfG
VIDRQKTIFITGAASGIGRTTASLFAQRGWYVGITDLNNAALQTLASEIGRDNCSVHVMDVTDAQEYGQAIDAFVERTHGRFDVLFNNAGILCMGANATISLEQQCRTVDINIKGVLIGIQAALPHLKRTANAHIITMGSTSSFYGTPELAVYSATKHAVRALTEALSIEMEPDGIVVCDIIAPYVNTPMVSAAAQAAHSIASTGINVQPEQVAKIVWRAAHGNRIHWKIHYTTHLTAAFFWIFPFLKRALIKRLCQSPGA